MNLDSSIPIKQVVLTVTKNKIQLIDLICEERLLMVEKMNAYKIFVVTGKNHTHIEVCNGVRIQRQDLRTAHEEADVIIPQQVIYLSSISASTIKVICDDTDVFVLLVHYYAEKNLT